MASNKNSNRLVSVIIPAFNVENWLRQCVVSVQRQTYQNVELVIIDDGSTDGTWSLINELQDTDSRIRPYKQSNHGLSGTRNRGIELAVGDILLFLDSDDWIHEETVEEVVRAFDSNDAEVVAFKCAKYDQDSKKWYSGTDHFYWNSLSTQHANAKHDDKLSEIFAVYPLAQLKAVLKSFLVNNEIEFIEGLKYEDNPFHTELLSLNPRIALVNRHLYAWRVGRPGQITASAHPLDCQTCIREMAKFSGQIPDEAQPYFVAAVTRLICGVAQAMGDDGERLRFLRETADIARDKLFQDFDYVLNRIRMSAKTLHPADVLLIIALFESPVSLSKLLMKGQNWLRSGFSIMLLPISIYGLISGVKLLTTVLRNGHMIKNFANGIGEVKLTKLG